jgi:hypothetical protein
MLMGSVQLFLWPFSSSQTVSLPEGILHTPDAPCMEYLPTFTPKIAQM